VPVSRLKRTAQDQILTAPQEHLMKRNLACAAVGFLSLVLSSVEPTMAQTPNEATSALPRVVRFSGVARNLDGNPLSGVVGITFALYGEQTGGAPLWLETQNLTADANGRYTALLGSTKPQGLPADLFNSEQARWVGVQVAGQPEQPRVLLASTPYALKAGDAETIGGYPPSAFVLAPTASTGASSGAVAPTAVSPSPAYAGATVVNKGPGSATRTVTDVTTTGGTAKYLPIFNGTSTIIDSSLYQTGTGSTAKVGIDTKTPKSVFEADVSASAALGPTVTLTNTGGGTSAGASLDFNTYTPSPTGTYNPSSRIEAVAQGNDSDTILFQANTPSTKNNGLKTNMAITPNGRVGIDTASPGSTVEAYITSAGALGPTLTLTNGGIGPGTGSSVDFNTFPPSYGTSYNPTARILATDDGHYSSNLIFYSNVPTAQNNGLEANFTIFSTGQVGVGHVTSVPFDQLLVQANKGSAAVGAFGWSATTGSGFGGSYGIDAQGGAGDSSDTSSAGGQGGILVGGNGGGTGGSGVNTGGGQGGNTGGGGGSFVGGKGGTYGGDGIAAYAGAGSPASNDGYAGYFSGNVEITGTLNGSAPQVQIDHPLDPANKYLNHASVASSERMNLYSGNVTTDANGDARVELPDWFESVNTDFRYQLTVIGEFAQAIVSRKVANHQFSIKTDKPNVEVSWQLTGVRQDAFAKAHPLVVEQEKDARERGHYINPELYGAAKRQSVDQARHPFVADKTSPVGRPLPESGTLTRRPK
jgi:trimeric autotransporter adhesin